MRIVTRADWDGLVSAVLLSTAEHIEFIQFVHPRDIQDRAIPIPRDSIIANLPYHPDCAMWFDHHPAGDDRHGRAPARFKGKFGPAPSAARLIYEYYGGEAKFGKYAALVDATDRVDSAQLTMDDVLNPADYILLAYTVDPRTHLKDLDRQAYFLLLLDWLKTMPVADILEMPEVTGLTERIQAEDQQFREALLQHSRVDGNVIITDFRGVEAPAGNRFIVYTLFPQANVSASLSDSPDGESSTIAVGHSIFNRTCKTNVGKLLAEYGGGGLRGVGTAQFPKEEAEAKFQEIIVRLKESG